MRTVFFLKIDSTSSWRFSAGHYSSNSCSFFFRSVGTLSGGFFHVIKSFLSTTKALKRLEWAILSVRAQNIEKSGKKTRAEISVKWSSQVLYPTPGECHRRFFIHLNFEFISDSAIERYIICLGQFHRILVALNPLFYIIISRNEEFFITSTFNGFFYIS